MEQIELIRHAVEVLDRLAVPYALVGSWGSGIYGEPRFTRDVDIVLDLNLAQLPQFCAAFPDDEFYLSEAVDRALVERWAMKLGYLEIWHQIVAKVDAPDCPPGPGNP